ncbi:metal-dependent hydrolase [Candidatus Woesearchaeota archaeon]|nr:metal-dependent hydrolase [Candidatus Woesearchaeota archaeon]
MLGRTHLAIGLLTALALDSFISPINRIAYYLLVLIGSILPDIDHEGSTINNIVPLTHYAAKLVTHRGIFHTIFAPMAIAFVISTLTQAEYGWFVLIGYLSHLASDSCTKLGVNWLHPFSDQKLVGPITTGTWMETLLFWAALFGIYVNVF